MCWLKLKPWCPTSWKQVGRERRYRPTHAASVLHRSFPSGLLTSLQMLLVSWPRVCSNQRNPMCCWGKDCSQDLIDWSNSTWQAFIGLLSHARETNTHLVSICSQFTNWSRRTTSLPCYFCTKKYCTHHCKAHHCKQPQAAHARMHESKGLLCKSIISSEEMRLGMSGFRLIIYVQGKLGPRILVRRAVIEILFIPCDHFYWLLAPEF